MTSMFLCPQPQAEWLSTTKKAKYILAGTSEEGPTPREDSGIASHTQKGFFDKNFTISVDIDKITRNIWHGGFPHEDRSIRSIRFRVSAFAAHTAHI
jgi:hypothetical protein